VLRFRRWLYIVEDFAWLDVLYLESEAAGGHDSAKKKCVERERRRCSYRDLPSPRMPEREHEGSSRSSSYRAEDEQRI